MIPEAYKKFRRGQKVVVTRQAIDGFVEKEYVQGRVVGFSRDGKSVLVRKDGIKSTYAYHPSFWDPHEEIEKWPLAPEL